MPPMCLKNSAVQIVPGAIGGSCAPKGETGRCSHFNEWALVFLQ